MRQPDIAAKYGTDYDIPIFYFTQLMGLAYGLPAEFLGLRKLMVDPAPLLLGIDAK
jgi:heterodisulfide reductase subunit B